MGDRERAPRTPVYLGTLNMNWKNLLDAFPESMKAVYKRAMTGKSKAACIKAHCLSCVGFDRKEVHLCTASGCALYPYRPYRTLKNRVAPKPVPPENQPAAV